MKNLNKLKNGELIDFVYVDIAGKYIRGRVLDWTQPSQLATAVDQLKEPIKITYLICILNQQVLNGGFLQYYDNTYGQFGYETLNALKEIKATNTHDLLRQSLELINPKGMKDADFKKLIFSRNYEINRIIEDRLDELDGIYYSLADIEDLEQLLGDYLKLRIGELG